MESISLLDVNTILAELKGPNGVPLKNRRYYLRTYKNVFVGSEMIDLLCRRRRITRGDAIIIGHHLFLKGHIRHIWNLQTFRDGKYFYQWVSPTDPSPNTTQSPRRSTLRDVMTPENLTQYGDVVGKLFQPDGVVIKDRCCGLKKYRDCMVGSEIIDALMKIQGTTSRRSALQLARHLQHLNLIEHVDSQKLLVDSPNQLYRFTFELGPDQDIADPLPSLSLFPDHQCLRVNVNNFDAALTRLGSNDPDLVIVSFEGYKMTDPQFNLLLEKLRENFTVRKLSLAQCFLSKNSILKLAEFLATDPPLEAVDVTLNGIQQEGVVALTAGLKKNTHVLEMIAAEYACVGAGIVLPFYCRKFQRLVRMSDTTIKRNMGFRKAISTGRMLFNQIGLTKIPHLLSYQPQLLTYLNLSGNQFRCLKFLENFMNLQEVDASSNEIQIIPTTFSKLGKLTTLKLRGNFIRALDEDMRQLKCLENLDISKNPITSLSFDALTSLPLKSFKFPKKSPVWDSIPKGIVKEGGQVLLEYLKSLVENSLKTYKARLMFVGGIETGKSTLINSMLSRKVTDFTPELEHPCDKSRIQIYQWYPSVDDKTLNLSCWDFPGRCDHFMAQSLFFSQRSTYVIVFSCKDPVEKSVGAILHWVRHVNSKAGSDAPYIIVGTHYDTERVHEKNFDRVKEAVSNKTDLFPSGISILPVSSKNRKNIDLLKDAIARSILSQEFMGEVVPANFSEFSNRIEILRQNSENKFPMVPYDQIQQIAIDSGISSRDIPTAMQFLHDWGTLIYFPKDTCLSGRVILDVQWVTDLISTTLSSPLVSGGKIEHKELESLWNFPGISPKDFPYLLSLLQKYDVLFPLPSPSLPFDRRTSLIPIRFPEDMPFNLNDMWDNRPEFQNFKQLKRFYSYQLLPVGFFSRLMTRVMAVVQQLSKIFYWKNGLIVEIDGAQLLLRYYANSAHVGVFLMVSPSRIDFSRLILDTIDTFIRLDYSRELKEILIPCNCQSCQLVDPETLLCPKKKINFFNLKFLESQLAQGQNYVYCDNFQVEKGIQVENHAVRIDHLAFDLTLDDINHLLIDFSEVQLGSQLGRGGFAVVYRGIFKSREVAVKVVDMSSEDEALDPEAVLREKYGEFRREVVVMAGLDHPNLVKLVGISMKPFVMVTEFLPFGDLWKFLHNEKSEKNWREKNQNCERHCQRSLIFAQCDTAHHSSGFEISKYLDGKSKSSRSGDG
eukprot:TRINITY_DN3341_c0_g1_i4.p1 TRINITY_DN3341_c0_g1~~TRINITY_DN3341_c0_g1_i4.p1  ORF type:complete len:1224 (+),score=344.87 TRINITY_DN3341_c0_g1_i4:109-3780(+)